MKADQLVVSVQAVLPVLAPLVYLKPNAAGDITEIPTQYPASDEHWDKVDDGGGYLGPTDGDDTYIQNDSAAPSNYKKDLFNMESLPANALSIVYVMLGCRVRRTDSPTTYLRISGKTNGVEFSPGISIARETWRSHQFSYHVNPITGNPWTVDEVNALQAGVALRSRDGSTFARCTQVFAEVSYNHYA